MVVDYAVPGVLTALDGVRPALLAGLADDPLAICSPVHALVLQPTDPFARSLPEQRLAENQVRQAARLVQLLGELAPTPLHAERAAGERVIGTCRHFAVIACALLRHRGVRARARCGFATYFQPDRAVDHWVVEYRERDEWIRVDVEVLGGDAIPDAQRLGPGRFLTGGEAWQAYRRGEVDAAVFGVHGTENWGPAEIQGNAVRDLAAMNKVEMLPWDEWGRMTEAYEGRTGADYDALLDRVADATIADDVVAMAALFEHDDLRVPAELIG